MVDSEDFQSHTAVSRRICLEFNDVDVSRILLLSSCWWVPGQLDSKSLMFGVKRRCRRCGAGFKYTRIYAELNHPFDPNAQISLLLAANQSLYSNQHQQHQIQKTLLSGCVKTLVPYSELGIRPWKWWAYPVAKYSLRMMLFCGSMDAQSIPWGPWLKSKSTLNCIGLPKKLARS